MALLAEALWGGGAVARGLVVVASSVLGRLLVASATPIAASLRSSTSVTPPAVSAARGLAVAGRLRAAFIAVGDVKKHVGGKHQPVASGGFMHVNADSLLLHPRQHAFASLVSNVSGRYLVSHPEDEDGGGCC